MTVYLMISLPKVPYIHRIYMVLANPNYVGHINGRKSKAHKPRVTCSSYVSPKHTSLCTEKACFG